MSVGISMGSTQDKIFTGWDYADTNTASPTYDGVADPKLAVQNRNSGSPIEVDPEVPTIVKVSWISKVMSQSRRKGVVP